MTGHKLRRRSSKIEPERTEGGGDRAKFSKKGNVIFTTRGAQLMGEEGEVERRRGGEKLSTARHRVKSKPLIL